MSRFKSIPIKSRFWSKVQKSDGCWIWTGGSTPSGYGCIYFNGKQQRAHRVVLMMQGIEIPAGACVMHKCDNPACVRPDHLRIGTVKDNNWDAISKGRNPRLNHLAKNQCINGHEYTPENTHIAVYGGKRTRICRACGRIKKAKFAKQHPNYRERYR